MKQPTKIILIVAIVAVLAIGTKKTVTVIKKNMKTADKKSFILSIAPLIKAEAAKINVPYLAMLGQFALETRYGNSSLWLKYNNPAGIKAVKGQKFIAIKTQEDADLKKNDGRTITVYQNFAVYTSPAEGVAAYGRILTNKYFKQYAGKTADPIKYIAYLQSGKPKYATDDNYVTKVSSTINEIKTLLV